MSGGTKNLYNAYKKMGIDYESLLDNANKDSGFMSVDEYEKFWEQMEDEKPQTQYMYNMLKNFLVCYKGQKDSKTTTTTAAPGGMEGGQTPPLEAFVNTINFNCLFMRKLKMKDNKIQRGVKKLSEEDSLSQKFPAAKNVIRFLKLLLNDDDLMGPVIIACSTLHTVEEFQELLDIVNKPTLDDSQIKNGEQCFLYNSLREDAKDDEKRQKIMDLTVTKFHTLSQHLKMTTTPKLAETTLLALLHILRNFMAIRPITDSGFLKKTIRTLQDFYLWPKPYGNAAGEVLKAFHEELMCPGVSMIDSLNRDCNGAEYAVNKVSSKALYYVMSTDKDTHPASFNLSNMFSILMALRERTKFERDRRGSFTKSKRKVKVSQLPPETQAMIILNTLYNNKLESSTTTSTSTSTTGSTTTTGGDGVEEFKKLNKAQMNELYAKFMGALDELKAIKEVEGAKERRRKKLAGIRETLMEMSKAKPTGSKLVTFPTDPVPPYCPELRPFLHLKAKCPSMRLEFETKEELRLEQATTMPFPSSEVFDLMSSLCAKYSGDAKPLELRLVISGDDNLLNCFLNAYCRASFKSPAWFKGIIFKFLVVPWGPNGLCSYLARHDSWYHRHIYIPFRAKPPFLIPWINPDRLSTDSGQRKMPPMRGMKKKTDGEEPILSKPGKFLRDSIESYARDAHQVAGVYIYKMEAWKPKDENDDYGMDKQPERKDDKFAGEPDQKIAFCQRVEIGQKPPEGGEKVVLDGGTPDLDVVFTPMNLAGVNQKQIQYEGSSFSYILLSNVPRNGDPCFVPNPLAPWLEMYALSKSVTSREPRQHIGKIDITCNNPVAKFTVMLDGQKFGPFNKIKISQITRPNTDKKDQEEKSSDDDSREEAFRLPIQTFFPLSRA